MAEFKKILTKSELQPGSCKTVEQDGKVLALFNVGGKFYALDNTCPHRGGPLGEGDLSGNVVTCPWHGWQFNVVTGSSEVNPEMKLKQYEVREEGENILVSL